MYGVDLYRRVRLACHREGLSRREASRQFGIDRKTVAKILLHSEPPGYRRRQPPKRPKPTVLRRVIAGCPDDPITLVVRAELHDQSLHCLLPIDRIAAMRERLEPHERVEPDPVDARLARLHLPLVRRRGETWVLKGPSAGNRPDPVLVKALRSAHAMLHQDDGGLPVLDAGPDTPYRRR